MDNLFEEFYIPTIDELCVGFEYEVNNPIIWHSREWNILRPNNRIEDGSYAKEDRWSKKVFQEPFMYGSTLSNQLKLNNIRVPKLRTADIIAEGWHVLDSQRYSYTINDNKIPLAKDNYFLIWYRNAYMVDIIIKDPSKVIVTNEFHSPERFRFYTKCPTINHFRKIEKLLP